MAFSLQRYFSNIFIYVILDASSCRIYARAFKGDKKLDTYEAEFDNLAPYTLETNVLEFLKDKISKYETYYLILYYESLTQGAFNGHDFARFGLDKKNLYYINMPSGWTIWGDKSDELSYNEAFVNYEISLLYSPFMLMDYCIKNVHKEDGLCLYIYNERTNFALGIFEDETLLFGAFFKIDTPKIQNIPTDKDLGTQNWDEDMKDSLEDFELVSEDDDLYDFEDLDEFDSIEKPSSSGARTNIEQTQESLKLIGRDSQLFSNLENAIREYYKNDLYKHNFISKIVIFDADEITSETIDLISSELMMDIKVEYVETVNIMQTLSKRELQI